jgi:hypothetical protein
VFKNEPPSAANRAQDQRTVRKEEGEDASYLTSVKNLMLNPGYVLLLFTYGMNVGVFYAISTLLSTTVVQHFEVISDEFREYFFYFPDNEETTFLLGLRIFGLSR